MDLYNGVNISILNSDHDPLSDGWKRIKDCHDIPRECARDWVKSVPIALRLDRLHTDCYF